jgi:hypothetical protein
MYQLMFEVHLIWPFGNYKEYGTNSHKYWMLVMAIIGKFVSNEMKGQDWVTH